MWYWPMWPAPTTPARSRPSARAITRARSQASVSRPPSHPRPAAQPRRPRAARPRRTRPAERRAAGSGARSGSLERALGREPRAVEQAVGVLEDTALGGRHPGAPEPDDVDAVGDRRDPVHQHVGRHVRGHFRHAADVRIGADPREGHHAREPADRRALADLAVARDPGVVDDDRALADLAIVGDVAHGHDEAALADVGPAVGARRAVDRDVLTEHGPGAGPDPGRGALLELQVLRPAAEHGAVADLHAAPELHAPPEHAAATDPPAR